MGIVKNYIANAKKPEDLDKLKEFYGKAHEFYQGRKAPNEESYKQKVIEALEGVITSVQDYSLSSVLTFDLYMVKQTMNLGENNTPHPDSLEKRVAVISEAINKKQLELKPRPMPNGTKFSMSIKSFPKADK